VTKRAAADGSLDEIRRAVHLGLDPSAADDDGWTPLHFAAPRASNSHGVSPVSLARTIGNYAVRRYCDAASGHWWLTSRCSLHGRA